MKPRGCGDLPRAAQRKNRGANMEQKTEAPRCPLYRKCGGCQLQNMDYPRQLAWKQRQVERLLGEFAQPEPVIGMERPYHYRNKVQAAFGTDRSGRVISGVYQASTHHIVPVESCLTEDRTADEIIGTVRGLLRSFRIEPYDERTGRGLLRHVLVKRGFATGQVMVALVTASPVFPAKRRFVQALRERHPEIVTVVQNVNGRFTSMVLGDAEQVLYGPGVIEDVLCGCVFRISARSFYQINPVQTEVLYGKAMEFAGLTGRETVIDAYCGIGTIGLVAAKRAKQVLGVECNRDAVRDAVANAKRNGAKNIRFLCADAGEFLAEMAAEQERADVVFLDPPRAGSSVEFLTALAQMAPPRAVYISCNPETQRRDLRFLTGRGYRVEKIQPVDMFPHTQHIETVALLVKTGGAAG